jgi:PBSX family phage portal protein
MTTKTPPAKKSPGYHVVTKAIGEDTYLVLADSATHLEDQFVSLYVASGTNNVVLPPPYLPDQLLSFVYHNNILNQCVEAMEVNVDGTGHSFVPIDDDITASPDEEKRMKEFFDEPYPGTSFVQIRRKLRRDLEGIGYAALEVLTNINGDILGLRNVDSHNLRFVRLDDPVMVTKQVVRDGKPVDLQMLDRERRFMQRIGNKFIYYREFGSTREVDKTTGRWANEDEEIPPENRGGQLLMFGICPDITSPYSVPRWINELPSVIGNRKAEEQNLEYLDAGGVPPAIVFVQGGTLAGQAAEQLRNYLSGKNKSKHRAVVVEAQSSSGSMESAGTVSVTVERFGSEKIRDAMFNQYDQNTGEHIRIGFRLPALFLGKTDNYNYATAVVAYMVAEEQVFQPERTQFDEIINKKILRAMGIKTIKMQSKGITLKDIAAQVQALQIALPISEGKTFIEQLNEVAGLSLEYKAPAAGVAPDGLTHLPGANNTTLPGAGSASGRGAQDPSGQVGSVKPAVASKSLKKAHEIVELAVSYCEIKGLVTGYDHSPEDAAAVLTEVAKLEGKDLDAFNTVVASTAFKSNDADLVKLIQCNHANS